MTGRAFAIAFTPRDEVTFSISTKQRQRPLYTGPGRSNSSSAPARLDAAICLQWMDFSIRRQYRIIPVPVHGAFLRVTNTTIVCTLRGLWSRPVCDATPVDYSLFRARKTDSLRNPFLKLA